MSGPDYIDVPSVNTNSTWDPSVNLRAPGTAGHYRGYWRMQAPNGTKFGDRCYVDINVAGGACTNGAVFKDYPGNTGAPTLREFNDYGWLTQGQQFSITFYPYNTGSCSWPANTDYCLHHNAKGLGFGPALDCETVDWTTAPGNAYTKKLDMTAVNTPGTYRITARMMKNGAEFGDYVNWDVHVDKPPNKPSLTGPGNGSTVYNSTVNFSWNDPGDDDNGPRNSRDYVIEIFDAGGTRIKEFGWTFDRSFAYTLPGPGNYSWHVHAGDGLGVSDWSDLWSFTYSNKGTLSVATSTNTACGISGPVIVDGQAWGNATQSREVTEGNHTVSFGAVAGWDTPLERTVPVTAGQAIGTTGQYTDATAPSINVTSPAANTCLPPPQTVSWTTSDVCTTGLTVVYAWDGGPYQTTALSGSLAVPDGTHSLKLKATDSAGIVKEITAGPFQIDATPPAAPTGLSATTDHYTATLNWSAPAENGCAGIAGYNVYRKRSDGGSYAKVNTDLVAPTGYTDRVANGVSYDYGVAAVDSFNREGPKVEITGRVIGKPGDLNGDGDIDISDVIIAINVIGNPNATAVQKALADYDRSGGEPNEADVEAMKKTIIGK